MISKSLDFSRLFYFNKIKIYNFTFKNERMMDVTTIMQTLKSLGTEQTKKTHIQHGAPADTTYGVKVGDLKTIVKQIKKNHELAIELYDTGNSDAMYLAGLIGDEKKMTKADFNRWAKNATWNMHSEYSVPFVAAESPLGWQIALDWINSKEEKIATAGWNTLSLVISYLPDEQLDKKQIESLLKRIQKEIHGAENRIQYTMNGFVISVGTYIPSLLEKAKKTALAIGKIKVEMGGTACKIPFAIDYIEKIEKKGMVGNKRKTTRC
jgi:3-methyladenine DNA glycosylase AlkD